MKSFGLKNQNFDIESLGITKPNTFWNLSPSALIEKTILKEQGKMTNSGALAIDTGTFTGRSPKDRFIVIDGITEDKVDWGTTNLSITPENFDKLEKKVINHLNSCEEVYVRDAWACANTNYRLSVRVINEHPWQNLFVHNMFLRPDTKDINSFEHDWVVYAAPGCKADPEKDGTRQENFACINFTKKTIIIGGTAYTGEIKKGIFSALNFLLPINHGVFPMHCSANVGKKGDTALFFGLSGTGKTTLSTDPDRKLIGDDEHGWSKGSVFNFEGGCYAKTIHLSESREPQIYKAIKFGALLENVGFKDEDNRVVDFDFDGKTQNTRVSYPIYHIDDIVFNSRGDIPENIFFLTCDAFGVLPPIAKLTNEQAMEYFLLGYTAKIAGTEAGINEPQATFSACFGLPFLPLHPTEYAKLLGEKLAKGNNTNNKKINVWLINTGWSGGSYGAGSRMELVFTRSMVQAALTGKLDQVPFIQDPHFGLSIPTSCPDVPNALLNPRDTWPNEQAYDEKAKHLKDLFAENFKKYESFKPATAN